MRVGELERLSWGDVDESLGRWRVSAGSSKTGRARWVQVPPDLFAAVSELEPRDDRVPDRPIPRLRRRPLQDRVNTSLHGRRCPPTSARTTSGTGASRCSTSPAYPGPGSASTSGSLRVTGDTYSHVLAGEHELDYVEPAQAVAIWREPVMLL
jgi:hypothetical protein